MIIITTIILTSALALTAHSAQCPAPDPGQPRAIRMHTIAIYTTYITYTSKAGRGQVDRETVRGTSTSVLHRGRPGDSPRYQHECAAPSPPDKKLQYWTECECEWIKQEDEYIYIYICIYQHVSYTKNHRIWEGPEELGEGPGDPLGGTMISKGGSL